MAMNEDDTITVYGKYHDNNHLTGDGPTLEEIAAVPEILEEEIEGRPSWDTPMSAHLREFADELWNAVRNQNPWFDFV